MSRNSPLTAMLVTDGLKPPGKLTDLGAFVLRLEAAAMSGGDSGERKRLLRDAARFIRENHAAELTSHRGAA